MVSNLLLMVGHNQKSTKKKNGLSLQRLIQSNLCSNRQLAWRTGSKDGRYLRPLS